MVRGGNPRAWLALRSPDTEIRSEAAGRRDCLRSTARPTESSGGVMPHLEIIIASTREGRKGRAVADWFIDRARAHGGFDIEVVDLKEVNLPLLDEPMHPRLQKYEHAHTKAWSETVQRADAFVVVTPEYDHTPPASLMNAFQYLQREWAYKPMAFVSYGGVSGGTRSVQIAKVIVASLRMMPLFETVSIPFFTQHLNAETGVFAPQKVQEDAAVLMLSELVRWEGAMRTLREPA
jgi:NAD(P)H-dependent FMN reductase